MFFGFLQRVLLPFLGHFTLKKELDLSGNYLVK